MSLYNMLFGMNSQADLLLAVIGFKKVDVERFRDVRVEDGGKTVAVYARRGGGNRSSYPQVALHRSTLFRSTEDDDFDSTYATFYFNTPPEFVADVAGLSDILANGLRPEFGQYLGKTLNREPTEADKQDRAYDAEKSAFRQVEYFMANGHTFVPKNDRAMEVALQIAEQNQGSLRTCWGILPLEITVKKDVFPYPKALDPETRNDMRRIEVEYRWMIDVPYWEHCKQRFAAKYPVTMAKIDEEVAGYIAKRQVAGVA